jgi:carbamoyl-phosphate synthase large subunit
MPKDPSLHKVLIIGSGPIVIGQAAEFDYAGTQACLACREEGVQVVLVNSNPATIQTDPGTADKVYIEPLTVESLTGIIRRERPDGLIATMGGQTGLNLSVALEDAGVLAEYGVRVLGTGIPTIRQAEDREAFADLMTSAGQPVLPHTTVNSLAEAEAFAAAYGYPLVVRAPFCLGGTGSGHAADAAELAALVARGLEASPSGHLLVEKSVAGWSEIEYEVLRDAADNAIIVCNMENLDPMGIHTGESIVVAPSQTLSDGDYHRMRTTALDIVRALDVRGGCNCQFAWNPATGELAVIEVNPRLSRSSALASKAAGYPIARVAAKIALGYTLAELRNDITSASSSAEPALDYVVVKLPRWPFDKFRHVDQHLGMTMKSTGEVMAIGRTFEAALLKALRSLDTRTAWLEVSPAWTPERIRHALTHPTPERLAAVYNALAQGWTAEDIVNLTKIHPWFIARLAAIYEMEAQVAAGLTPELLAAAKRMGFADEHLAHLAGDGRDIRAERLALGIRPVYKMVDSCAGEFAASTPYFYSTYAQDDEATPLPGPKAIVLGSGPIRIGQGIEFDYSSVHAVQTLRAAGIGAIVINNNPETVSTDYSLSDRLYFEPLTLEEVLNVIEQEREGLLGVIAQFGGQTALNLIAPLAAAGVPILGTTPGAIAATEDRRQMGNLCAELGIPTPAWTIAQGEDEVVAGAAQIGFPVLVRPSYVLGGRGMRIVHSAADLTRYLAELGPHLRRRPVLIDRFLQDAVEVDVDGVADGHDVYTVVMEQLEAAGVHSGDSTCVYPPQTLSPAVVAQVQSYTRRLVEALGIVGLINVQYAVQGGRVYLLEVNARASRTVPFASKATGIPLARLATQAILGTPVAAMTTQPTVPAGRVSVKTVVLPFDKFPALPRVLGPEMQSTGEAMGVDTTYAGALAKARLAAGQRTPAPAPEAEAA